MSSPTDGTFTGVRPDQMTCAPDSSTTMQTWTQMDNHYTSYGKGGE